MLDTIELLETIGQDASLRHASTEELTRVLKQAQAPEILTDAVVCGDSSKLSTALWPDPVGAPQISQIFPFGEG